MSIGSYLAAFFGCDNCAKMHRRAQAAESEAAKAMRAQLRQTMADARNMKKPRRPDTRDHRIEQLRNALEYIASGVPVGGDERTVAQRALRADNSTRAYGAELEAKSA
jgi:hypothetical protein